MQENKERINQVIQFCLLVAGEEDNFAHRSLGPIHLLKYVYLADYYYAIRNQGETYTGIPWTFYNFGPWSAQVHSRLEPALKAILAEKYIGQSDYGDGEFTRWSASDENRLSAISKSIPSSITLKLKRDIHRHLQDTDSLLSFVYSTEPMINAAPDELLDFNILASVDGYSLEQAKPSKLSAKKEKKRSAAMDKLKEKWKENAQAKSKLVSPIKSPRYDKVYDSGISWLTQIDGPPIQNDQIEMKFDESIWKSGLRRNGELS